VVDGKKRRREEPGVRRAQILAAAKKSFSVHGLQATTVDRIAQEAEVSVGLLYRLFESKAAIIQAIIIEDVELQLSQIGRLLEEAGGNAARLPGLLGDVSAKSSLDRDRLALMLEIAAEVCRNRDLRTFVQKKRKKMQSDLALSLEAMGAAQGDAHLLIEQIDRASAVATGLAVYALIHADTGAVPPKMVRSLVEAAVVAAD
jgi:AcrR family transcriptional regulator